MMALIAPYEMKVIKKLFLQIKNKIKKKAGNVGKTRTRNNYLIDGNKRIREPTDKNFNPPRINTLPRRAEYVNENEIPC
jgi:hypothetical protein